MTYDFHTASAADIPAVIVFEANDPNDPGPEVAVFYIGLLSVDDAEDLAIDLVDKLNSGSIAAKGAII